MFKTDAPAWKIILSKPELKIEKGVNSKDKLMYVITQRNCYLFFVNDQLQIESPSDEMEDL